MLKCGNACPTGQFDGCCVECFARDHCDDVCGYTPQTCSDAIIEGNALEVFQTRAAATIKAISDIVKRKSDIEAAEKQMREQLEKAMREHGIKQFDNDVIKATYIEPSTRTSVDSVKLKAQQPEIYAKFSKTSNVKGFVKIELKLVDKV